MGYAFVDNRASGGQLVETDTVACRHCSAALRVGRGVKHGAFCTHCHGPVCPTERCARTCVPTNLKLDRAIEARYRRAQNARVLGLQG